MTSMPNDLLRIRQTVERLSSKTSAERLLNNEWLGSPFKLMFVSGSQVIRKWGTYLPPGSAKIDDEINLSGCDYRCRTIRRHLRIPEEYDVVDSVADAHTLIQTIWPVESVVERLAGTLNVELFVAKDFDWEASIEILAPFHTEYGGRTEAWLIFGATVINTADTHGHKHSYGWLDLQYVLSQSSLHSSGVARKDSQWDDRYSF